MKKIAIGIVAHVDSGKTTLSEGLLYQAGEIRKLGAGDVLRLCSVPSATSHTRRILTVRQTG